MNGETFLNPILGWFCLKRFNVSDILFIFKIFILLYILFVDIF